MTSVLKFLSIRAIVPTQARLPAQPVVSTSAKAYPTAVMPMARDSRVAGAAAGFARAGSRRAPRRGLAGALPVATWIAAVAIGMASQGAMAQSAATRGTPGTHAATGKAGGDTTGAGGPASPALSDAAYAQRTAEFDAQQQGLNARTAKNDYAYGVAKHDCYARFFVNHCLDVARDSMRDEREKIRQSQLTLSADRRAAREEKREADDAQRLAQQRANAPQRAANEREHRASYQAKQQQHAVDQARRGNDAPQRQANAAAYANKQSAYQQKLDTAQRNAATDAQKRAENVQRYQSKQDDATARQQSLDQRREDAARRAAAASGASAAGPAR
ncbi:hypothetical protein [Robbsia sp. KACC 23696]|uniref:hypothetical protein n=1 Tax=Robbsia sp. KACC 23696 TaxID=3149231 RepID=UPI00325AD342